MLIRELLRNQPGEAQVVAQGWVRTRRDARDFSFLEINDGSCLKNLQVIAGHDLPDYQDKVLKLTTGCAVSITGRLAASPAAGQPVELKASRIENNSV